MLDHMSEDVEQSANNAKLAVGVTAIYFQSPNFPPFALNWIRKETPWEEDKRERPSAINPNLFIL